MHAFNEFLELYIICRALNRTTPMFERDFCRFAPIAIMCYTFTPLLQAGRTLSMRAASRVFCIHLRNRALAEIQFPFKLEYPV